MCGRLDLYLHEFAATGSRELQHNRECSLLLLAVIDQISTSQITKNFIEINKELEKSYITVANRYLKNIEVNTLALAFIALEETNFWYLRPKSDTKNLSETNIYSLEFLRKYYWGASFTDDLFPLLKMENSRNKLCEVLLLGFQQK